MDLGNGVHLDRVGKFCYLRDMISGGGGVNSGSVARLHCTWGKLRELSGTLTKKDASLKLKEKVCVTSVRSAMVQGSETWAINTEQIGLFE